MDAAERAPQINGPLFRAVREAEAGHLAEERRQNECRDDREVGEASLEH